MNRRYDICWRQHGPAIEPHYCREWDENGECHGMNDKHGFSWDEACAEIAAWHLQQSQEWAVKLEPTPESVAA